MPPLARVYQDSVFTPGFAYLNNADGTHAPAKLQGKTLTYIVTTHAPKERLPPPHEICGQQAHNARFTGMTAKPPLIFFGGDAPSALDALPAWL